MKVKDRKGILQEFDRNRIKNALRRAFNQCHYNVGSSVIEDITNQVYIWDEMSIEEIQDQVEELLMDYDYSDVAKEYILYRYKHQLSRQLTDSDKFNTTITEIATGKSNDVTNENGNKDARRFNVMRDLIAGESCKKLYKEFEANKELLALHEKGAIHIHDMDYRFMRGITNCSLISLYDMLWNGTVVNGKLIERPHSLRTATTIATQIMVSVTSAQYGGISITLSHLAPFVRVSKEYYENFYKQYTSDYSKLVQASLKKEIRDSMQTLMYQLNSMTSTNGQSPFCTVFCYIHENEEYIDENVALIEEFLRQRIKGMKGPNGNNINPSFPKIIYVLDEDNISPGTKYYHITQLAAECTSKRMVPDYISAKVMKQYKEGCVFPSINKLVA